MSFKEVLAELPSLSVEERQALVRRALELDEMGLPAADEALIAQRLAEHRQHPASAISQTVLESRLRARFRA